jgi:membrane protein YqaA with SNARE-associated domain
MRPTPSSCETSTRNAMTMARLGRILAVTAGLIAAGAVFGAVAGALALGVAVLISGGGTDAADAGLLSIPASLGAVIGAVAAPAAGWLALRSVPLWRAVAWTTAGAVGGGVVGWFAGTAMRVRFGASLPVPSNEIELGILGALLGFIVAAVLLRRGATLARRRAGQLAEPVV